MLQLTAIGRLTKDPEIKKNSKGTDFIVFDPAVNKGYGDNQTTTYVSCCAGGILVSPLSKAKKGSLISITGELSVELYQTQQNVNQRSVLLSVKEKCRGKNYPSSAVIYETVILKVLTVT